MALDDFHAAARALSLECREVRIALVDHDRLAMVAREVDLAWLVADFHLTKRLRAIRLRPSEVGDAVVAEHVGVATERASLARLHAFADEALEALRAATHRVKTAELSRRAVRGGDATAGSVHCATRVLHGASGGGDVILHVLHD